MNRFIEAESDRLIEGGNISIIESDKIIDIRDSKWAHPDITENWVIDSKGSLGNFTMYNESVPLEAKKVLGQQMLDYMEDMWKNMEHTCEIKRVTIDGCPEEPETKCDIYIVIPQNLKKKNNRAMLYLSGGALVSFSLFATPVEEFCNQHRCIGIVPIYRLAWQAPYPGAINDIHAAYKYIVEHAEELTVNANNIVITGMSSGAHLGLSACFRLKRYGYRPKGVVALAPQTDDRERGDFNVYNDVWDSITQRKGLKNWLGDNFCSSRVGPEALANHATVRDCVGYPPCFIHTAEFDPDRENGREFYGKLLEAQVYTEYHCWGGAHHSSANWNGSGIIGLGNDNPYSETVKQVVYYNLESCFQYDLSRPWTEKQ